MDDSRSDGPPSRSRALARADFPLEHVAELLGIDPGSAAITLRDDEAAREAVLAAGRAYLEADADHRAGRTPGSPLAAHPDFPTGIGMSLVGASVLWDVTDLIPAMALRVATDHLEDGDLELAGSFAAMVGQFAREGTDDAEAWAAQSLLVVVLGRGGRPADAEALARDLAAHGIPVDLWKDSDPHLPDDSMAWHGGAFVEGLPPRRDGRALSVEEAGAYVEALLADTVREFEAEREGEGE